VDGVSAKQQGLQLTVTDAKYEYVASCHRRWEPLSYFGRASPCVSSEMIAMVVT
jgi:hypothetical protein